MGDGEGTNFQSRCIYIPKVEGQGRLARGTTRTGQAGQRVLGCRRWQGQRGSVPAPHPGSDTGHSDVVCWALKAAGSRPRGRGRRAGHREAGAPGSPDGLLRPAPVPAGAMGGHRVPSPVPGRLSGEQPPLLPLRPTTARGLTRQRRKAPGQSVIGPRAGTQQCVPEKGCSWLLAIKWGPGRQKGFRGGELLSSAPNFKPRAGPGPERGAEAWKGVDAASVPRSAQVLGLGVLASDSPTARPWPRPCLASPGWNALL